MIDRLLLGNAKDLSTADAIPAPVLSWLAIRSLLPMYTRWDISHADTNGVSEHQLTRYIEPSLRICQLNIEGISKLKCETLSIVLIEIILTSWAFKKHTQPQTPTCYNVAPFLDTLCLERLLRMYMALQRMLAMFWKTPNLLNVTMKITYLLSQRW